MRPALLILAAILLAGCGDPRMMVIVRNETTANYVVSFDSGAEPVVVGANAAGIAYKDGPWIESEPLEVSLVDPGGCAVLDQLTFSSGRPHLLIVRDGRFVDGGEADGSSSTVELPVAKGCVQSSATP